MDRIISKPKYPTKKIVLYSSFSVLVILVVVSLIRSTGHSEVNIERDKISTAHVEFGQFREYIPVDGIVLPVKSIYLDAIEGGRVSEKYAQDGDMVIKGQALLKLVNTDLQLDFLHRETQAFDLINNLQNARNTLENNKVNRLTQLADVEFELREAERLYELNESLYKDKVISKQEYLQSENNYNYYKKKKILIERAIVRDSITAYEQMKQMQESHGKMRNNLELMRQKTEDLIVRAPADGQLSAFRAEIGELKTKGQNLGQLDIINAYKVRAQIDEHYISRIQAGQKAEFEYVGKTYMLTVKVIYPQVANGRFDADLEFESAQPLNIKKGQNLQLKLQLSETNKALLLARGGFYQQTGGNWVYVIKPGQQYAEKRNIRTGRQNPLYYEISEGLKEGEEVIISSYETIGDYDRINLK
jgi:HlyD family secretion protein